MPTYLTVAADGAAAELEVKRSRFVARLARVTTEDEARAIVEQARTQHWGARHHCSAFVLGPDARVMRSSDDGEPPGTAGAPMLEVLRGRGLSDVVAVVSRYFGGVLLGAGGLVRAYSDAVRAAVDAAALVERRLLALYDVQVEPAAAGRLENLLRTRGVLVRGVEYTDVATLHLAADAGTGPPVGPLVSELTAGGSRVRAVGSAWVDVPLRPG